METIENNKLIAEFMGAFCEMVDHTEGNEDYCKSEGIDKWLIPTWSKPEGYNENKWGWGKYRMGYFEYHESWDWLMPVVEKIDDMFTEKYSVSVVMESLNQSIITIHFHQPDPTKKRIVKQFINTSESKISSLYKTIVEFIIWYNNVNK